MIITYDDHTRSSYMVIIYERWSYLRISGTLWVHSGSSLEALWGTWVAIDRPWGILRQSVLKHVCFSVVNEQSDHFV